MVDILNRENQRTKREEEQVREFSISQLVRAGMVDYTNNLRGFLQSDSRLTAKRVIESMYLEDEATLALTVLRTVITVLMSKSEGLYLLSSLSHIVAKSVLDAKTLQQLETEHKALSNYIDQAYKRGAESKKLKAKLRSSLNLVGKVKEEEFLHQGSAVNSIGSLLISILIESIDLVELIKLDSQSRYAGIHYPQFKPFSYLVHFTDDTMYGLLELDEVANSILKPLIKPMLTRPKQVTKWDDKNSDLKATGRPRNIIKMPYKKQNLKEFRSVLDVKNNLSSYRDTHHVIESTSWTINEEVYNVIKNIFENNIIDPKVIMHEGEHYAYNSVLYGGLPRRYSIEPDKLIQKEKLGRTYVNSKGFIMFDDKEGLNRYNTIKNDLLAFNEANLNKALSLRSMLNMAEEYIGKTFWFNYQYDNRSRIYTVQSGLSPQSDKRGKALLKLSEEAQPLTERGRYWAKIQGANCYGYDKETMEDRAKFMDVFIEEGKLKRIAKMPIMYIKEWAYTDDPFGFLAFCIEYQKTLEDAEHPYAIPTALDATCSGIQIYSGLLRDRKGAEMVNVVGQDRKDIYGAVADEVNKNLELGNYERYSEFTNSNGEVTTTDYKPIADSLKGKLDRNICKRNTMTQPYSVTMRGMQDQLKETFKELEEKGKKFWVGEIWQVSKLVASMNQEAIDTLVKGAKVGKDFIRHITGLCASKNQGLLYTTKIGFPVYQKNVKCKSAQVDSHIWTPEGGLQKVKFRVNKKVGKVNTHSQKNSSAPNLIHSLDSTLLHFTVWRSHLRGVKAFALIHDSYGTHPNDCDILSEEVRESFIEIFSDDVLYDWAIEVLTNAGFTVEDICQIFSEIDDPMINDLDLKELRDATYFFS